MNSTVSCAVAAILSGVSLAAFAAQPAPAPVSADANVPAPQASTTAAKPGDNGATDPGDSASVLKEVMVTATRSRENIQDVPITMQALTGSTLQQLNISTFQDYVQQLPNLTSAGNGPGQNEIFMRGISAGSQGTQGSGLVSMWPVVAVYLDDQAVQLPNRNLDIYAVDLDRVEVLEGPQGTLFGSSALAGAIRYITNKPKLDTVEGNASASYGFTAGGDPNNAITGVFNLPIIPHHLAMRFVAYSDHRGGYIDNVAGSFTRHDTDLGIHYANYPAVNGQCPDGGANNGYCVPPGSPVANNAAFVGNNINPVTYQGGRLEALYQINDDWSFLVTQMYQAMDADGVFYQFPNGSDGEKLGPDQVTLFSPNSNYDKFDNTAWTLEGKLGFLNALYTGGFLTRDAESHLDYTNYARGVYGDYYQCFGPGTGGDTSLKSTCFSPVTSIRTDEENTHIQHEIRLQTPQDLRVRGLLGLYMENDRVFDQTDYMYKTIPPCTSNGAPGTPGNSGCLSVIGTFPGSSVKFPGLQTDNSAFDQDGTRQVRQYAEYLSASVDLIPHALTLTAGTRHFAFLNDAAGAIISSFGCFEAGTPPNGCLSSSSYNLNNFHERNTESGWRSRANLAWNHDLNIGPAAGHVMTYITFSQGFRPGGFNQNVGSLHAPGPDGEPQYAIPETYNSDSLNDYEIGWKANWRVFDRRFQWNTAFYREDWNDAQIQFFDPGVVGNVTYETNGQNFRIDGTETSIAAELWRGLTLQAIGAWNSSTQLNSPSLVDNNPQSVNFGKPITEVCASGPTSCVSALNPFGPPGSPSADSPPIHYTFALSYDLPIYAYLAHFQFGASHQGHFFTQAGSNPAFVPGVTVDTGRVRLEVPAYTTYSASIGVSKDQWDFNIYGENLANSNAAVFESTQEFILAQTPLRPRVIGARFDYHF
jgi:iron complex outermembrane recepter protein